MAATAVLNAKAEHLDNLEATEMALFALEMELKQADLALKKAKLCRL